MSKKPSGTPGPPTFLFRLFAPHTVMISLAFSLHAGAQQPQETSFNQPAATASVGANPSVSLVDAPSATFSRAAATVDAPTEDAAVAGVVRPPPAKLTREERSAARANAPPPAKKANFAESSAESVGRAYLANHFSFSPHNMAATSPWTATRATS